MYSISIALLSITPMCVDIHASRTLPSAIDT